MSPKFSRSQHSPKPLRAKGATGKDLVIVNKKERERAAQRRNRKESQMSETSKERVN